MIVDFYFFFSVVIVMMLRILLNVEQNLHCETHCGEVNRGDSERDQRSASKAGKCYAIQ